MRETREEMRRGGDGDDGIWVTEIGWGSDPSSGSQLATTPRRQAALLRRTYSLMLDRRSAWNLRGVLWYTWRDPANPDGLCGWCASAGLVDNDLDPQAVLGRVHEADRRRALSPERAARPIARPPSRAE